MKTYKLFLESKTNYPTVGSYVMCYDKDQQINNINDFLSSNIGKIISKSGNQDDNNLSFTVKYDNVPDDCQPFYSKIHSGHRFSSGKNYTDVRVFFPDEIIEHSRRKKDLVLRVAANKYNL